VFRSAWIRAGVFVAFGVVAAYSPSFGGHPFVIDGWLWRGVRELVAPPARWLPLAVSAAMVVADCLGAWLPAVRVSVRRPVRWATAIAVVAGGVLWLARVPQWLGDYGSLEAGTAPHYTIEAAEPLGAWTSYHTIHVAEALGVKPATAVSAVVTVFGASGVAALFLWTRRLTSEWPLALAMMVSSGFMVLFCGYPEKGTPKALALSCWYVLATTVSLQRPRPLPAAASGSLLALAGLMHGSGVCWLPAQVWCVWRRQPWRCVLAGFGGLLVPLAAMAWYVKTSGIVAGGPWGNIAAPWQWFKAYCITNCGYDFWSIGHLADVLNCLLALSPVGLLCVPEALWRARGAYERWLALGTTAWLVLSAVWFPVFGYLADWDIFATTPFVLSCLVVSVAIRVMSATDFRRLACAWIVGNGLHTVSFWYLFRTPL